MFLKLKSSQGGAGFVYVNKEQIKYLVPSEGEVGTRSLIVFGEYAELFVLNSPEEIIEMISTQKPY